MTAHPPLPSFIDVDGRQRPTSNSMGRPIHATEEAVRNFGKWFGDSKTVDQSGRPQVFFHGTGKSFDAFDPSLADSRRKTGVPPGTFCFSDSPEVAASYAERHTLMTGTPTWKEGGNVMPVYLRIMKPLVVNARGENWNSIIRGDSETDTNELFALARSRGRDGAVVRNVRDSGEYKAPKATSYAVFDRTQVKSAIGNSGRYCTHDTSLTDAIEPRSIDLDVQANTQGAVLQKPNTHNGRYAGKVVLDTGDFLVQDVGRGTWVVHDKSTVAADRSVEVGDAVRLQYAAGQARILRAERQLALSL